MDFKKINSAVCKFSISAADQDTLIFLGNRLRFLISNLPVSDNNKNLRHKYIDLLLFARRIYMFKKKRVKIK